MAKKAIIGPSGEMKSFRTVRDKAAISIQDRELEDVFLDFIFYFLFSVRLKRLLPQK